MSKSTKLPKRQDALWRYIAKWFDSKGYAPNEPIEVIALPELTAFPRSRFDDWPYSDLLLGRKFSGARLPIIEVTSPIELPAADPPITFTWIADQHRHELGYVRHIELARAVVMGEVLVLKNPSNHRNDVAFAYFHLCTSRRKRGQLTIYAMAVAPGFKRRGFGRQLIDGLIANNPTATCIVAKCVVGLPANDFYQAMGFVCSDGGGTKRKLNLWRLELCQ